MATGLLAGNLIGSAASAAGCEALGLARHSGQVMQLREAAQNERTALTYRDTRREAWFVALQGERVGQGRTDRLSCTLDGLTYWRLEQNDPALQYDSDHDELTFLDISQATQTLDGRQLRLLNPAPTLDSTGINYQLALNYADRTNNFSNTGNRLKASAFGDFYAYTQGWYANTSLGWSQHGKVVRYQTYALRESLDTGLFLRLGDAVSKPTPQGESLQFAGLSWGTDRNLRPGDFSPVLPTLRNGNVLPGPLEVFINDTLQFQQTLQSGVYDLRNIPAQQGFNSYTVRTLDAQGNPVTVQREIYLPSSLLPPDIASWRIDAGFQREDFFIANAHYGAPFVAGSYARGLSNDVTVGGQALYSRAASTLSADYDQRLSDLWTGHLGLQTAQNAQRHGQALQARIDGGSRQWRLLAEGTHAFNPLPGLGSRAALVSQRLVRAQWSGIPGWNLGLTLVRSQRERVAREEIASLVASTRVMDTAANLTLGLTQTQSAAGKQNALTASLFLPLAPSDDHRNRSLFASQSSIDGTQLSRAQYSSNGQTLEDANWTMGATRDSRQTLSSVDAMWTGNTDKLELMASGRASQREHSGLLLLRSGLLWTSGSMFSTRPITGAFAMVSAGEKDVDIYLENRPVGQTNEQGMLLVPGLRAFDNNRLTVNPATWPIHWLASQLERNVIPPRGGGVLVSFKINARVWPTQTLLTPLAPDGKSYPAGTVVHAVVDDEPRETVIDRRGQLWIAELLPAATFSITQAGQRCAFKLPMPDSQADAVTAATLMTVTPGPCQDVP